MRGAALLLAFAVLVPGPAALAQNTDAASVYRAFDSLLGSPELREIYALPPDRYWRATGPQTLMLRGGRERSLSAPLMALADDFSKATGLDIQVRAEAKPSLPDRLELDSMVFVIAGRADGVRLATDLGIDEEQRLRFGDGRWPALFHFRRNDLAGGGRAGVVILADDISLDDQLVFFGLSLVWALGGASLGDDLDALFDISGRPSLTDPGKQVFALMYHPDLANRMPLDDVRSRARAILGLPE